LPIDAGVAEFGTDQHHCYGQQSERAAILRFPDLADFVINAAESPVTVRYRLRRSIGSSRLRHVLLDHVFPRVLTMLGERVLHGALLSVGGHGIAIIGPSGAGKSTLAAALNMRSLELHSDDVFVLRRSAKGFLAQGAYPSLRLWPDSLKQLFPSGRPATVMSETSSKRCLHSSKPLEDQVPLKAIVVLDPSSTELIFAPAKPAQACIALVANSFLFDPSDSSAAAGNLKFMSDVAIEIPTFVLGRPQDYGQLPALCDVVLSTLDATRGSTPLGGRIHDQHVAL
jgi:hypothetical protein